MARGRFISESVAKAQVMEPIVTKSTECPIFHMIVSRRGMRECVPGYVYIARCGDLYKIGSTTRVSTNCISDRLASLRRHTGLQFSFVGAIYSSCAKGFERTLHLTFASQSVDIEFSTGYKVLELFRLLPADIESILATSDFNGAKVAHIADLADVVKHLDWNR